MASEFCEALFPVIGIALLLSWVVAVTVTPLLGYYLIRAKEGGGKTPEEMYALMPDLLEKSYRVRSIWFDDENCRTAAEKLTAALSRYGEVLDYGRRKLQKQSRALRQQDLLVVFFPEDTEKEMPIRERFRNLHGNGAAAVPVYSAHSGREEEYSAFLRERGFRIITELEKYSGPDEEWFAETALLIREKVLQL